MTRRFLNLQSMPSMIFDCYLAECFNVEMKTYVRSSTLKNATPGKLYTFIFRQDYAGGHRFNWPAQCQNGAEINLNSGAVSIQNFVAWTGNVLQPTEPGAA